MVELDKKYNPQNTVPEPEETLINSLPLPIYDSYKLLQNQTDYEKSLQILCLSLIPWSFQYIALILSGEYLNCKEEPAFEATDSLLNMVKKPGPGKWINFTRAAAGYFINHKTMVISAETVKMLNTVLNSNERPRVKVPGNKDKLDYADALISVRNRFAHSRSFSGDKAKELFLDYFQIWKAWISIIRDIFSPRLLFRPSLNNSFKALDIRPLETDRLPSETDKKLTLLWDGKSGSYIKLYPVIVNYSGDDGNTGEVAFLEEIKSRYLFYLQGDNFFKLKDGFDVLSKIIETKTIIEELVAAEDLTLKTFSERIDRITNRTLTDFQDALKFIPEIYADRPAISSALDKWAESKLPGCIITGNPGTGKTSLIASWCIKRKTRGDHVLLLEASRLRESDITMIIGKELNLGSPLKECLDAVQKQNLDESDSLKSKKFIIVIDAVNEFTGKNNENRGRLWRDINILVSILNLYSPYLKCLVSTRSDLWDTDFQGKGTAEDILNDKLYWSENSNGFPRLLIDDLSEAEAGEIYELSRRTSPSMEVQNSFADLSPKTRRVLCNPFLLRLALVTYNGKKVPNLTKPKIEKRYAKEKITENRDKTGVLFALLERMSELRKTEITFDEFLSPETKSRSKKKASEKTRTYLEQLIFDPRPESPYKKLINEGIIEESTDENNIESKEKIRFSQEKITDIIYSEFQRRDLRRQVRSFIAALIILIALFSIAGVLYGNKIRGFKTDILSELNIVIKDQNVLEQASSLSYKLISKTYWTTFLRGGFGAGCIYCTYVVFILFLSYTRFFGARIIKRDLPSRFLKEKFNEIKVKKFYYGLIPLAIILIWFLFHTGLSGRPSIESFNPLINSFPFVAGYIFLWGIILGNIIVYKTAASPQDAFCMFGKKEVLHTVINFIPVILFSIVLFLGARYLPELMRVKSDAGLMALKKEWNTDKSVIEMGKQVPGIHGIVEMEFERLTDDAAVKDFGLFFFSLAKIFASSLIIILPFLLLIQYFNGLWLYKILKRKLHSVLKE